MTGAILESTGATKTDIFSIWTWGPNFREKFQTAFQASQPAGDHKGVMKLTGNCFGSKVVVLNPNFTTFSV